MAKIRTETRNDGGGDYLVIHQPNVLRQKVGKLALDPAALERAEVALRTLAVSYPAELARCAKAARGAWDAWRAAPGDESLHDSLAVIVHDIKGQAGTMGFPLATEVARSLAIVLKNPAERLIALAQVVETHLGALAAIAAHLVTDDGGPLGQQLVAGLRQTLEKYGIDPTDGLGGA